MCDWIDQLDECILVFKCVHDESFQVLDGPENGELRPKESDVFRIRYEFSRPPRNVKWVKDGSEPRDLQRVKAEINGCQVVLTVDKAKLDDTGMYSLQADQIQVRTFVKVQRKSTGLKVAGGNSPIYSATQNHNQRVA
jgi:hypothetical protein